MWWICVQKEVVGWSVGWLVELVMIIGREYKYSIAQAHLINFRWAERWNWEKSVINK